MQAARLSLILSIGLILSPIGCTKTQEQSETASPSSIKEDVTATTVLATIADDDGPPQTIAGHTALPELQNRQASFPVIFSESGKGVAYVVEKENKLTVVHNRQRGREYDAVGTVVLSTDGRRIAYAAKEKGVWRMVVDGREGSPYDVLLTPIFSPDGRHVAYQAREGKKWYIVVDTLRSAGTLASYTTPEFNAESTMIAYVEAAASNSAMQLIVTDLKFNEQHITMSIGDQLFVTSEDRRRIAAEQVVGNKVRIIEFSFAEPAVVLEGPLYDLIERLTFGDDSKSVAYCALKGKQRLMVLDNREEGLPKGLLPQLPVVRPDKKGVGAILTWNDSFFFHQSFFTSYEKETVYDEAADLAYSRDGRYNVYAARRGADWFVVVNGKEGPSFDRVVTPLFSPDGKKLIYRARKDGRRFVVVADTAGRTIKELPAFEQVFQPLFTADGKSLVYGIKDGNKLICKVEGI